MMLEVNDLSVGYTREPVLQGVSLTLAEGEIVTLIGANGAGKSTLVKAISGLMTPMSGRILFEGNPIQSLSTVDRLRLGISHVPEGRQVFAGMTVAENLRLGSYAGLGNTVVGLSRHARIGEVCAHFPILKERLFDTVGNFSGGQQQMLAIARGLMSGPRLLMLDEPSLGLSPLLVQEIFRLIRNLRDAGLTILLVEQNARSALQIADRGYVIENGRITLSGPSRVLLDSSDIAERYLGVGAGPQIATETSARLAARLRECMGTPIANRGMS